MTDPQDLLSVENLRVCYHTRYGTTVAVSDMTFRLQAGQVLCIVGESGSGKSVASQSLLGLTPSPPGKIERGRALLQGQDLLRMSEKQLRAVRGNRISMIFQDPMTCLNPYMKIGAQLVEPFRRQRSLRGKEGRSKGARASEEGG